MSYIIKCTDPFVSIKLTETGREQLAKGLLNFAYWAAGDSEVNYDREENIANYPLYFSGKTSQILRPKDRQPDIKSYVCTATTSVLNALTPANIRALKAVVNNAAETRGFFSGSPLNYTTLTGSPYTIDSGFVSYSAFTGGTYIEVSSISGYDEGNFILFKFGPLTGMTSANTNTAAYQQLWFKIQASGATTTELQLDRTTPDLSSYTGGSCEYIVYSSNEVKDAFGLISPTAYWDTGTLTFESSCNVSIDDVPVWNMNNVWQENLAGMSGTTSGYVGTQGFDWFGSYDYLGTMNPYLEFDLFGGALTSTTALSTCQGLGGLDYVNKSLCIIHYTNYTISNYYGEFFYIDNDNGRPFKITMPDLMYSRFSGSTGSGTTMGMSFIATGDVKTVGLSEVEYYDLIEDPTYLNSGSTVLTIGRVYPQLKIVTIHDEEIVAALSYKSNRNWTLPPLAVSLENPPAGVGVLPQNKTMYITYALTNTGTTGFTSAMPCQKYAKITNYTNTSRDVSFRLEEINALPYMRKIEDPSYDGYGFYATNFKVVFQIVDDPEDRPVSDAWSAVDLTTTAITTNALETIDPLKLENQNPYVTGFILTSANTTTATTELFDVVSLLQMPDKAYPDYLQFGDERFFYGNLDCYIGATIFKTIFSIMLNSNDFLFSTNPTMNTDPNILVRPKVTEIGIYDSDKNLVIIGKLSEPVEITGGQTIMIELSIDF